MKVVVRSFVECGCGGECLGIGVVVGVHGGAFAAAAEAMREVLDDSEADGDKKDAEEGGEHHAADHDGAENLRVRRRRSRWRSTAAGSQR